MFKHLMVTLFLTTVALTQTSPKPLTQVEACQKFTPAVVGIQAGPGSGSGFIVSSDGWIVTAAHVVVDLPTRQNYPTISVFMPNGTMEPARQMLPTDQAMVHDLALLKVDKTNLPYLKLGNERDIPVGSPITIIGFPISTGIAMKFCLAGNIAAKASQGVGDAQINVVFFQGVSVKGISGAPIISLENGSVIAIEDLRLTGIGPGLERAKQELAAGAGSGVIISGLNFGPVMKDLVNVLDEQLANGLGAGRVLVLRLWPSSA
jgi:hypothetical protein